MTPRKLLLLLLVFNFSLFFILSWAAYKRGRAEGYTQGHTDGVIQAYTEATQLVREYLYEQRKVQQVLNGDGYFGGSTR